MLCPDVNKIMPETVDCQGFAVIFSTPFSFYFTVTYGLYCSKYFKNIGKKMTLS